MLFDYPVISPCMPCRHSFLHCVYMDRSCYTSVNCTVMFFFEDVIPLIFVWPEVVKQRGSTWESSNSELSFQASG